jgi:thiol-disulfide isomerase/thioredoxin
MKTKNLLIYGGFALLFGSLGAWYGTQHKQPPPLTTTAPAGLTGPVASLMAQQLVDDHGVQQALSQWRGKTLLVNFWASWCAPCVEEMPELSAMQADDGGKRFQVIGIGIDSPANIAEFAKKMQLSYPVYVGGLSGTDLSRELGNDKGGLPFTVLIGADGQVKKTYLGRLKFSQLRADLAAL